MRRKKSKKKEGEIRLSLVLLIGLEVIGCALLLHGLTVGKSALILKAHYSGWKFYVFGLMICCGLGLIDIAFSVLHSKKRHEKSDMATVPMSGAPVAQKAKMDLGTPEGVYEYIKQMDHGPVEVREQLDKMNTLQARLDELLAINHHETSLKEAQDLLQAIENAICLNVRKAINFRIVGGESAFSATRVSKLTAENAELLVGAEELLFSLAEFINNGKGDLRAIVQRMKDYRETINEMLEEDDNEKHDEEDSGSDDGRIPALFTRGV
ncbi:hypothetical protein IKE71_02665 [Candidatus Saccharibacteria bacterium]|nr:hypothetical protein [Candidatus Saccharibacteria bacterium]